MSLNILIVDDSAVMRAMIARALRASRIPVGEIAHAVNGEDGLTALDKAWVDLVFLDINMPVMTGEEMLTRMRQTDLWRDIPVVVVSTEGSRTRIDRLAGLGARFVHKPWTAEKLCGTVVEATGVSLRPVDQEN